MAEVLFNAHSGLRYLVLVAALAALVLLVLDRFSRRPVSRGARISSAIFTGMLDLQVVLGLVLLLAWPWYGALTGHLVMMVLALIAAHALRVAARRSATDERRAGLLLLAVVVPLVLIVGGIMAIGRSVL